MNRFPLLVRYVAHSIDPNGGGMERMGWSLITKGSSEVRSDGVIFSLEVGDDVQGAQALASLTRRNLPRRPAFARILSFWLQARSGSVRNQVVHSCGAIMRGRADLVTVHLVHAAAPVARGANSTWRYLNQRLARRIGLALERRMYRPERVGVLVAVSENVARELAIHYPDVPVRVIENGVDIDLFSPAAKTTTGSLKVLMVTGDFALKGVAEAIDSLVEARNVDLVVVGRGPTEQYLERARSLGVVERVTFTGFLEDVRECYDWADVILCLSAYESFGLFLVEAALSGCAVVSTNVGVARQLIDGGQGGVELVSPEAAGPALGVLSQNRDSVHAMGRHAAHRATHYSLDRMIDEYLDVYRAFDRSRPRVVHVGLESPEVRRGGLNHYLTSLHDALTASDQVGESRVIWIGASSEDATGISLRSWPQRLIEFAAAIRRSEATVIDVHFSAHVLWAVASGAFKGRPFVVHFQGPWGEESRWTGGGRFASAVKTRAERFVLRRAERVVVLSRAFADIAITRYRVEPRRVVVLAPGAPSTRGVTRDDARARLGRARDEVLIVSVRRLVARMGLDTLLWSLVEMTAAHLVIVGDGPERDYLEGLADDLGVRERVTFAGVVSDEERDYWLSAASVVALPSLALEGFGLVALEALSQGTPVVASRLGGLIDAASLSPFVTLVTPSVVSEWVDALSEVSVRRDDALEVAASISNQTWSRVAQLHVDYVYRPSMYSQTPRQLVVLDHTAKNSGGELAMLRLMDAVSRDGLWSPHVILFEEGELREALSQRGISSEIVALAERTNSRSRAGLTRSLSVGVVDSLMQVIRLRRRLARIAPEIVHANSLKAIVIGSFASLGSSWRYVVHVRDLWRPPYISSRVAAVLRVLLRLRADVVVANSAMTAAAVSRHTYVVPSPVDSAFESVPAPRLSERLRLVVVGRLAEWKGQDLLLDALELCGDLDVSATIVGDALFGEDDFKNQLVERVARDFPNVTYVGSTNDVPSVFRDVDALVLTSRSPEPFGNVVTEAMLAGRVVIVPRQGGVTEFVEEGVTGLFYEPNSAPSLAAVIRRLAQGEIDPSVIGANAHGRAKDFAGPVVARKMQDIYARVLE